MAIINYVVDSEFLEKYLPAGTELDLRNDVCYLSLVGFMFKDTRVLGIKIPSYVDFEEVNLRFYVKRRTGEGWRRGVVFVKEIVPKYAITLVANGLYKEHYETKPMRHCWEIDKERQAIEYSWKENGNWSSLKVNANTKPKEFAQGSLEEFISEHYWGYTRVNKRTTFEYEVVHPKWKTYPVEEVSVNIDFALSYGQEFGFLNNSIASSTMLFEGSKIKVNKKTRIKL